MDLRSQGFVVDNWQVFKISVMYISSNNLADKLPLALPGRLKLSVSGRLNSGYHDWKYCVFLTMLQNNYAMDTNEVIIRLVIMVDV